jgi:hypothetical protein
MLSGYCQTACCPIPPLPLFQKAYVIPALNLAEAALRGWTGSLPDSEALHFTCVCFCARCGVIVLV